MSITRGFVLIAVGLAIGAGCGRPAVRVEPVATHATGEACVDSLAPWWRDSVEATALVQSGGQLRRLHCRLTFRTEKGDTVAFVDNQSEGDHTINYTYLGRVGTQLHLISVGYYEGGTYMLLEPGGAYVFVAGPPLFSPDMNRFASFSMDLEADYVPNVIEVWRVNGRRMQLEIAIRSEEWGPSDVLWTSNSTLTFTRNFPTDSVSNGDLVYRKRPARLVREDSTWSLHVAR